MEQVSREKSEIEYKAFLTKAGCLFAYVIFDEIMTGDTDLEKLKHLPGIKDLIETFRTQFKEVSEEYLKKALDKNTIRDKEIDDFEGTVKSLRGKDDAESTSLIDAFNRSNKEVVLKLTSEGAKELYTPQDVSAHVDELIAELERVCDELMSQEIRQTEKFESIVDEFDNRYATPASFYSLTMTTYVDVVVDDDCTNLSISPHPFIYTVTTNPNPNPNLYFIFQIERI
jgi:hypothetical protein